MKLFFKTYKYDLLLVALIVVIATAESAVNFLAGAL